jgi:hypothetical protein
MLRSINNNNNATKEIANQNESIHWQLVPCRSETLTFLLTPCTTWYSTVYCTVLCKRKKETIKASMLATYCYATDEAIPSMPDASILVLT